MELRTFRAATIAEALEQVKSSIGHDALILHTRTFQQRKWLGLRRTNVVEITASRGQRIRQRAASVVAREEPAAPRRTTVVSKPVEALPSPMVQRGQELLQSAAGNNAVILGLSQEMTSLKTMVQELVTQTRQQHAPQVPEELFDYYMKLIENQVAEGLAEEIVKSMQKQIRPEYLSRPDFVREKLADHLERLMPTAGPISRTRKIGPQVVALIGPTGVGKTTTIAKLAATLKIHQKHTVGLITIDTYRIAAVEQLKKYADILDAPLRIVSSTDDMRAAVASMQDCEFILIDTAGRSPTDTMKLNELKHFLAAANPDEVHLVLSTTASQACVELAVERFSKVRVDKIIFTKIDEAAHVGVVLNVIKKVNKSLSYITTGQDVPNDIEPGNARHLANLILKSSPLESSRSTPLAVSRSLRPAIAGVTQ